MRVCVHLSLSMCARIRISCGSDMGFGCDRRACKHAHLCGAGCSSTAEAQWFTSTLCACEHVLLHETVMSSVHANPFLHAVKCDIQLELKWTGSVEI